MSTLTANARKHIAPQNFALGKGRYPIEDKSHALAAERDASLYATPAQKAEVDAKVTAKYPGLGSGKKSLYSKE